MALEDTWIAVVEDHVSTRNALVRILEANDFSAVAFASGQELLAAVSVALPLCAIIDICLPPPDGLELHALLRKKAPTVPVIFTTARDDPAIEAKARACSRSLFLWKPFDEDVLLTSLHAMSAWPRRRNQVVLGPSLPRNQGSLRKALVSPASSVALLPTSLTLG